MSAPQLHRPASPGGGSHHHHHHHHGGLKVVRTGGGGGGGDSTPLVRRGSLPTPDNFSKDQTTYLVHSASRATLQDVVPVLELPAPPDGGWGWVVVAAGFLCNLVLDGIAYSFGILLGPLSDHYGATAASVSWVGSLLAGVYQSSGPLVGGLVNKFGCRVTCMAGGVVACLALLLSTRAASVPLLALTYGVVGGLGLGLVYLPSVVVCGYYFEKRRALATGIAVCGSGAGTFVFAPLANLLLDAYGWKGTYVIFAGLCLNCCVFGALMRPLELVVRPKPPPSAPPDPESSMTVQLPDGTKGAVKRGSVCSGSGALGLPKIPSIILTPHHSLSLLNEEIAEEPEEGDFAALEEEEDDDDRFEEGTPMSMLDKPAPAPTAARPPPGHHPPPRRRTVSENPSSSASPFLRNVLAPSFPPVGSGHPPAASSASAVSHHHHGHHHGHHIRRNKSNPTFGRLSRGAPHHHHQGHHQQDHQPHVMFGVDEGAELALLPTPQSGAIVRPMSRKDIFYGGSVLHLAAEQQFGRPSSPPDHHHVMSTLSPEEVPELLTRYRHSVVSIPRTGTNPNDLQRQKHPLPRGSIVASHLSIRKEAIDPELQNVRLNITDSLVRVLKEMVDVRVCRDPLFVLVCLAHFMGFLALYVPYVYLPSMMVTRSGATMAQASMVISALGVTNTASRVAAGWLVDRTAVSSLLVTNLSLGFSGVFLFCLPHCHGLASYMAVGLLLGLSVSPFISLTSIVLVDLLGLDNLTSSFGLLVAFRGVSTVLGPPLAGAVFAASADYAVVFRVAGGFFLAGAASGAAALALHRRRRAREEREAIRDREIRSAKAGRRHSSPR